MNQELKFSKSFWNDEFDHFYQNGQLGKIFEVFHEFVKQIFDYPNLFKLRQICPKN